ncbi:MAG: hypothetical protein ABI868_05810 [Acidobacteriota bacterium]
MSRETRDDRTEEHHRKADPPVDRHRSSGRVDVPIEGLALPRGEGGEAVEHRDRVYHLRGSESRLLHTAGAFRVVPATDLAAGRLSADAFKEDLRHLSHQGLIERRTIPINHEPTRVVVLTREGKALLDDRRDEGTGGRTQQYHAGLVKPLELGHDAQLYHVHARSIYRALQQDDNRNRRRTSAAAIARKLMILDFVLGEPGTEWYATEADKVAFFTQRLGVPPRDLPQRRFASDDQRLTSTTRYFVHKLPIGVAGDPPRLHFVTLALDPSGQGLASFLHDHARLLSHLPDWTIVAVGPKGWAGETGCRPQFDRYVAGIPATSMAWDRREVARYFVTRRAVDANDLAHLSVTDLNHCREARRQFADPIVETLYARWLVDGDRVLNEWSAGSLTRVVSRGALRACELPYTYEQFGDEAGVC